MPSFGFSRNGRRSNSGKVRLAADDAQIECVADTHIAGEIVGDHRLLQPIDVVFLEFPAHLDRGVGVPAHVDVDHDLDVRAERLAHPPDVGKVGVAVVDVRDLHLDGAKSLLDEVPGFFDHPVAAEHAPAAAAVGRDLRPVVAPQPMQRHPGALAHRVPQSDVDGGDRHHGDAAAPRGVGGPPQVAPDRLDGGRVLAEHARRQRLVDAGGDGAQHRGGQQVEVAHADDPACRLHFQHQQIAMGGKLAGGEHRVVGPRHPGEGHAQLADGHVGHGGSPIRRRSPPQHGAAR